MPRIRSLVAVAALAAAAVVALSGCAPQPAASSTATAGTNTVSTLYGKVAVPANPKRVVAFGFPEATALVDLGIIPVGRPSYIPALPAYTKAFKHVPDVTDSSGNPDLEKIAALKPDLIVGDEFADQLKPSLDKKLSAIAPTVVLKWTEAAGNWRDEAAKTAQAVGRTAQLHSLIANYDAKADEIKKRYAAVLKTKTVDLVSGDADNWFLYSSSSSHGRVLADAGVHFGAAASQKDGFVEYSPEKYSVLQKTGIIIVSATSAADAKPVTTSPVFAALPAAKAGDVSTSPYFFSSSYRIADALLGNLATALKAAQ